LTGIEGFSQILSLDANKFMCQTVRSGVLTYEYNEDVCKTRRRHASHFRLTGEDVKRSHGGLS